MAFSEWLKQARADKRLSLRELARLTNGACTFGYLSQLENDRGGKKGIYQPDIEIVDAIATALEKNIDEARHAAGYAGTSTHYINGFEIQLPDDVTAVIPYDQIDNEDDAKAFAEAFLLAYEITKKRIAERDKK